MDSPATASSAGVIKICLWRLDVIAPPPRCGWLLDSRLAIRRPGLCWRTPPPSEALDHGERMAGLGCQSPSDPAFKGYRRDRSAVPLEPRHDHRRGKPSFRVGYPPLRPNPSIHEPSASPICRSDKGTQSTSQGITMGLQWVAGGPGNSSKTIGSSVPPASFGVHN